MIILPESPKFLMSRGRNDAAMDVFARIHRMNNGSHVEYPVRFDLIWIYYSGMFTEIKEITRKATSLMTFCFEIVDLD